MTAIEHTAAPDPIPALLVGRLAVDETFAGLGVGTALVRHLLATAVEINLSVACKAVVVTALHEQARNWWQKLGFEPFEDGGLDLYLLTADIQKTLGSPRTG